MHWTTRGLRDPQRTVEAIRFAEALWDSPVPKIALENPVSVLSTRSKLGRPNQIIQPYYFGEDASKKTCLWLKNLPLLRPTKFCPGRKVVTGLTTVMRWPNQTDSGQNRLGPSDTRAAERAKTYEGVAQAMSEQWGNL
jgi:hypothetical protein